MATTPSSLRMIKNATRFEAGPNRICLMGHCEGATVAGAVLINGRYRLDYDPADPSARGMYAHFGADPAVPQLLLDPAHSRWSQGISVPGHRRV
jgi:hypothetical protein